MSNDLISRKEVVELIKSKQSLEEAFTLLDDIEEMQTAYDVEKAMELLEAKILGKVCIGCAYLKDNVCTYKGANCNVSKPMYEVIKKAFEEVKTEIEK